MAYSHKEVNTELGDGASLRMCSKDSFPGEGNGNPLQYSCLENPMDRGAWRAIVYEFTKNWTRLSTNTLCLIMLNVFIIRTRFSNECCQILMTEICFHLIFFKASTSLYKSE